MQRTLVSASNAFLKAHVSIPAGASLDQQIPTFGLAVREARTLAGRDIRTGFLPPDYKKPVALWAASIAYLVLIEQIGKTLRPARAREIAREKEFERALRQFAKTTKTQRAVLYALRCAFAHEYGLCNGGMPLYRRAFRLTDEVSGTLIKGPSKQWDGNVATIGRITQTTVSLVAVGDLAEAVVASVQAHATTGSLRSRVSELDLRKRFAVTVRRVDRP